jgi:hypothetical protein
MSIKDKLLGTKADRDELTAALKAGDKIVTGERAYEANQERIRKAETKLPAAGRIAARDASL